MEYTAKDLYSWGYLELDKISFILHIVDTVVRLLKLFHTCLRNKTLFIKVRKGLIIFPFCN